MEFVLCIRVCRRRTTTYSSAESYSPATIRNQVYEPMCEPQAFDDPEADYVEPQAFDDSAAEYVEPQAFNDPEHKYEAINEATIDKTSCA